MRILTKVTLLIVLAVPSLSFANFNDIPETHSKRAATNYVQSTGLFTGYTDGTFKPDQHINRAEFFALLTRLSPASEANCSDVNLPFIDVPTTSWYHNYVCQIRAQRLLNASCAALHSSQEFCDDRNVAGGFGDKQFHPSHHVTTISAITEIFKQLDEEFSFSRLDSENIIPSSISYFDQPITRGEVAEIIYRIKNHITDKTSMPIPEKLRNTNYDPEAYQTPDIRPDYTLQDAYWDREIAYKADRPLYNIRAEVVDGQLYFYFLRVVGVVYGTQNNAHPLLQSAESIQLFELKAGEEDPSLIHSFDISEENLDLTILEHNLNFKDGYLHFYVNNDFDAFQYKIGSQERPISSNFYLDIKEKLAEDIDFFREKGVVLSQTHYLNFRDTNYEGYISPDDRYTIKVKAPYNEQQYFLAIHDAENFTTDSIISEIPFKKGGPRYTGWDFHSGDWNDDSKRFYFDNEGGNACIWELDIENKTITKIVPEHSAKSPYYYNYQGKDCVVYWDYYKDNLQYYNPAIMTACR